MSHWVLCFIYNICVLGHLPKIQRELDMIHTFEKVTIWLEKQTDSYINMYLSASW